MNEWLFSVVLSVHVLLGLAVIGLVLLQHGKGADAGATFGGGGGGGSAGSFFGSSGSANFFSRTTAVLATLFFVTSLGLNLISNAANRSAAESVLEGSIMQTNEAQPDASAPAVAPEASDVPVPSGSTAPAAE